MYDLKKPPHNQFAALACRISALVLSVVFIAYPIAHAEVDNPVSAAVAKLRLQFKERQQSLEKVVAIMLRHPDLVSLGVTGKCLWMPKGGYGPFRNCIDVDPSILEDLGNFKQLLQSAGVSVASSETFGNNIHEVELIVAIPKSSYGFISGGYEYQTFSPAKRWMCPSKIPTPKPMPSCYISLGHNYYIEIGWMSAKDYKNFTHDKWNSK